MIEDIRIGRVAYQKGMRFLKSWLLPGKTFWGIFGLSLLLSFLFNIYIFQDGEDFCVSVAGWIASSAIVSMILMVSIKWRWIGFILLPVVVFVAGTVGYIHAVFGAYVNYEIVASICETHVEEAAPYCTWDKLISAFLLLIVITVFVGMGHRTYVGKIHGKNLILPGLIYCLFNYIFLACIWNRMDASHPDFFSYLEAPSWPLGDFEANYDRICEYKDKGGATFHQISMLPSMADSEASCMLDPDEKITVIVHIGESVRADHLQINGYDRETTPLLAKREDQIVSFKNCHSFGLVTRVSIVGLLTDAELASRQPRHSSFVNLFNRFGYETASVLYSPPYFHDFPLRVLTKEAKHQLFVPQESVRQDEPLLLPTVRQVQKANELIKEKRKLILVYDNGAHIFFNSHPQHKKFLPDDYDTNAPLFDLHKAVNAYDNNLAEIDWELDAVMGRFEKEKVVLIHISDHGVALGEGRHFGQGYPEEPVKKPSFFIWMSDSFKEKYPDFFQNLKKYENMPVSHDYLLHTLLSLGGLRYSGYKEELDLTGPNAKPFDNPPTSAEMMGE